ncbi:toll/interleukin-1 receptor domain-containing protein [Lacinutrix algicola]|uniref:toll/interleukin-1 receptor domain-containing protein n=1 Tax=Lacinutrix algicola TaxID=342954 RepID=UPI0006E216C6|nr:SEFIR domain-containing protein [Lacinutrix algicola]
MSNKRKIVFISYSWDSQEHQEWVLNFAKNLMEKFGIEVILDQFELSAGKDLTHFMESSIIKADKVLIILTPNYKIKAEERKSGVGYETSMITQEIFESPISKVKFIPVLREGNSNTSSPKFLKSKLYHEMSDDSLYLNKVYELSKIIYDKPIIEKPELGEIPDFSKKEYDPIIDIANSITSEEKLNNEINFILESTEGVELFRKETQRLNQLLKEKTELYKNNTQIQFTYESNNRDSTIIHANGYSVSFYWRNAYSNSTRDSVFTIRNWKGYIRIDNSGVFYPGQEPKTVRETKYNFDLEYNKSIVWKQNNKNILTTEEIVQTAFVYLIEEIKKEKEKQFRK